jgi:hypothetical protein
MADEYDNKIEVSDYISIVVLINNGINTNLALF